MSSKKPAAKAPQPKPMTPEGARRIQAATALKHEGRVPKDSFASRAQSAADRKAREG